MSVASNVGTGAAVGSAIPGVGTAVGAGTGALFSALQSLFGSRSETKREEEQRRAIIAALTLRQKRGEDSRLGKLAVGQNYLENVPEFTGDGSVRTNVHGLPPDLLAKLSQERTYDFESAVPHAGAGGFDGLLSGLFGTAHDTAIGAAHPIASTPEASYGGISSGAVAGYGAGGTSDYGGSSSSATEPNISLEQLLADEKNQ